MSHSTSHSETNPAVSCSEVGILLANRISELDYYAMYGQHANARDLLEMMTYGAHRIHINVCTDAMNIFELVCHSKALLNDKYHRVGVLALREDRLCQRLRCLIHLPTEIMLADPLTKHIFTAVFVNYVTLVVWDVRSYLKVASRLRMRRGVNRPSSYTERDLLDNKHAHGARW